MTKSTNNISSYVRLFKQIDNINKQTVSGSKRYNYKKHIKAKTKDSLDIYGKPVKKGYQNDSQYVFLLDNTGSMVDCSSKMEIQVTTLLDMISALDKLDKSYAVYGFTSTFEARDTSRDISDIRHNEFIPLSNLKDKNKADKTKLKREVYGVDYEAQKEMYNLLYLYDEIMAFKKKHNKHNRINIIMFSDGGASGMYDYLKAVISYINENAEKNNIHLFIFNIRRNDVDLYGELSEKIYTMEEIPKKLRSMIRKTELR